MELSEAGNRIIGQHWRLILVFVLLGANVAAALHVRDVTKYTASTRMVLGTADPKTSSESTAISDTAWALGTAPSNISAALAKSRVTGRDPAQVAKEVSVKAVGASGVLELSVSDPNPRAAAQLANAIASKVVQARLESNDSEQRAVLADIDRRINSIDRQIARLDSRSVQTPQERALSQSLNGQRITLETQRTTARLDATGQPQPTVVSPASPPADSDASGLFADLLLGAILGAVIGGGLAALIETLRPTVVGGEALARELGAPLLGTLPSRPAGHSDEASPAVAGRLRLAGQAAGVQNIGLLPLRNDVNLPGLAQQLVDQEGHGAAPEPVGRIKPFDIRTSRLVNGNGGGTGLVIVAPEAPKKAEIDEIRHLLALTPEPLLGILTYTRAASSRAAEARNGHPVNGKSSAGLNGAA